MRRWRAMVTTAATLVATVLGFAAPAHAIYTEEPATLAWHPAGPVHSSVSRDGVVYLGGKLDGTGGIAAVDAATGNLMWLLPANKDVRALALSPDGSRLFAGGTFTAVNGQTRKHLAAVNLADHSLVAPWTGKASGLVRDLVVSGDTLFVAGAFVSVDGVASKGIGAVSATTGARITTFNHAVDTDVDGLALTSDTLLMSGTFTQVDGQPRASIAAIDLTTFTLTSWAPPRFCDCDTYWDVQTDGTYAYVGASGHGGNFTAFDLTTGVQPWPYVHTDGDVQAVWLPGDGRAYLGGHFAISIYNTATPELAVPVTVLAAVDLTTGQPDPTFNPKIYKVYPGAWALTSTADKLWVGGDFTGERQNGANNKLPYLAAYPGI
jgi:PQQ-like domain